MKPLYIFLIIITIGVAAFVGIWFLFSGHPLCYREGVGAVRMCTDGSFKVEYVNLGGGYDIFKSDGTEVSCPVINPDLLDEDCFTYLELCTGQNLCPPTIAGSFEMQTGEIFW